MPEVSKANTEWQVPIYTPENKHDIAKSPFSIGNTSSNGGFSIVMLVFGRVNLEKG